MPGLVRKLEKTGMGGENNQGHPRPRARGSITLMVPSNLEAENYDVSGVEETSERI